MKPLILIKIGGSLITDKNKPFTLRSQALERICKEIKQVQERSGRSLIIGHGAGSFAHVPAKKYQTHLGIIDKESHQGIAEVQDVAAKLNRIVVGKLIKVGVDAVSINPSSCFITKNGEPIAIFLEPVKTLLKHDMLPVFYGDVVFDREKGCSILSTEKVLVSLALALKKEGFMVEKMIHCGRTKGVYDREGKTIPLITRDNIKRYEKVLESSEGIDVTGGMSHKVHEALRLAEKGIPSLIIDGVSKNVLIKTISAKKTLGTEIK